MRTEKRGRCSLKGGQGKREENRLAWREGKIRGKGKTASGLKTAGKIRSAVAPEGGRRRRGKGPKEDEKKEKLF